MANKLQDYDDRLGIPGAYWPDHYDRLAMAEGWLLTNDSDDNTTISRLDDPSSVDPELDYEEPKFENDAGAQAYVVERALQGSPRHLLAVYLLGRKETERLNMAPPAILLPRDLDSRGCYARGCLNQVLPDSDFCEDHQG